MDTNKEKQLKQLQIIFETWMPPTPAFKTNHQGVPKGMIPYISCSDVHDYQYNIRVVPLSVFMSHSDDDFEKKEIGEIIAHYNTLEELVEDGWQLD